MKNSKKSFVLLTTTLIILFISLSIGAYVKYSTTVTLQEFHKDLAKLRGYWAVYGAKEVNASITYPYHKMTNDTNLYSISAIKTGSIYSWTIINDANSGIKNENVFRRVLTLDGTDSNRTLRYSR